MGTREREGERGGGSGAPQRTQSKLYRVSGEAADFPEFLLSLCLANILCEEGPKQIIVVVVVAALRTPQCPDRPCIVDMEVFLFFSCCLHLA